MLERQADTETNTELGSLPGPCGSFPEHGKNSLSWFFTCPTTFVSYDTVGRRRSRCKLKFEWEIEGTVFSQGLKEPAVFICAAGRLRFF